MNELEVLPSVYNFDINQMYGLIKIRLSYMYNLGHAKKNFNSRNYWEELPTVYKN